MITRSYARSDPRPHLDDVEPVQVADGVLTIPERKPWWSAGSAQSWNLSLADIRSCSADWVKRQ
jgi:hypothetical protein